jgi:hypothetical protein
VSGVTQKRGQVNEGNVRKESDEYNLICLQRKWGEFILINLNKWQITALSQLIKYVSDRFQLLKIKNS